MQIKYRCPTSSVDEISRFFINPTNYTHKEYAEIFGVDFADEVFQLLYKSDKKVYRQIVPLAKKADELTTKYLFQLYDHRQIETVCIKRRTGISLCLSTQVGCSVRCKFCKSGEKGFFRNLSASEIVQQILFVNEKINRIVIMGIGEPLNNYDEVMRAIHIIKDRKGMDFPTEGITISTVGPVDKLKKFKEEHLKTQLVLSLHATDQEQRDTLIPGMSQYSINETISEVMEYSRRHNRQVTIAYLLLPGINNRQEDLLKLIQWFKGKNIIINLMKYNGHNSNLYKVATDDQIGKFKKGLESEKIKVSIRQNFGLNIDAACGQLVST